MLAPDGIAQILSDLTNNHSFYGIVICWINAMKKILILVLWYFDLKNGVTFWINLKNIILSEMNQSQRGKDPTYINSGDKLIETENSILVARSWGKERDGKLLLSEYKVLVSKDV